MLLSLKKLGASKLVWKPQADVRITHRNRPAIIAGIAISSDNRFLATHAYNASQLSDKRTHDHVLNIFSLQDRTPILNIDHLHLTPLPGPTPMLSWQPNHPSWDAPERLSIITEARPTRKGSKQAGMAVILLCPLTGDYRKLGGDVIGEGSSRWGKGAEGSWWKSAGPELGLVTEQTEGFGFYDFRTVQLSFIASIQDLATGQVLRVWQRPMMNMFEGTCFRAEWAVQPNGDQIGVFQIPTDSDDAGDSGRSCRNVIALTFRRSRTSDKGTPNRSPWKIVKEAQLGRVDMCKIHPTGAFVTAQDTSKHPDAYSFVQIDMDTRRRCHIMPVDVYWSYDVAWVPGPETDGVIASVRSPHKNMLYVVSGSDGVTSVVNASLHARVWKWEAGSVLSKLLPRCQPRKPEPVLVDRYPNEWRMHPDDLMSYITQKMECMPKCICAECSKATDAAKSKIETKMGFTPDGKLAIAAHDVDGRCCVASVSFD